MNTLRLNYYHGESYGLGGSLWKLYTLGEILESQQQHYDMCWVVQNKFFSSPNTDLVICAKFQAILWEFANSKNKRIEECGMYHQCLDCIINVWNLVFSSNGIDLVMCAKFHMILMPYGDLTNDQRYLKESLWKLHRWNLGVSATTLRYVRGSPN